MNVLARNTGVQGCGCGCVDDADYAFMPVHADVDDGLRTAGRNGG